MGIFLLRSPFPSMSPFGYAGRYTGSAAIQPHPPPSLDGQFHQTTTLWNQPPCRPGAWWTRRRGRRPATRSPPPPGSSRSQTCSGTGI